MIDKVHCTTYVSACAGKYLVLFFYPVPLSYLKFPDHELLTTLDVCSVTCQFPSNKQNCRCALQADFTFVCPSEIVAFSDRLGDFHEINTEVRLV